MFGFFNRNKAPSSGSSELENAPVNFPTTSSDQTCNFYLKELERMGRTQDVANFLRDTEKRDFQKLDGAGLQAYIETYNAYVGSQFSADDNEVLKRYSGFGSTAVNQVARGYWDYDRLGRQTPELVKEVNDDIQKLSETINNTPSGQMDIVTYRGTTPENFRGFYDSSTLENILSLQGQIIHDAGFVSTTLNEEENFANKEFDGPMYKPKNVLIKYKIPAEARETVGLLSSDTTYSPNECEILIDKGSLFYVSKVEMGNDSKGQQRVCMEMTLIPRSIYDRPTA